MSECGFGAVAMRNLRRLLGTPRRLPLMTQARRHEHRASPGQSVVSDQGCPCGLCVLLPAAVILISSGRRTPRLSLGRPRHTLRPLRSSSARDSRHRQLWSFRRLSWARFAWRGSLTGRRRTSSMLESSPLRSHRSTMSPVSPSATDTRRAHHRPGIRASVSPDGTSAAQVAGLSAASALDEAPRLRRRVRDGRRSHRDARRARRR